MLTPKNIVRKWILSHLGLNVRPVNRGHQLVIPAKMPNTAPIDRT